VCGCAWRLPVSRSPLRRVPTRSPCIRGSDAKVNNQGAGQGMCVSYRDLPMHLVDRCIRLARIDRAKPSLTSSRRKRWKTVATVSFCEDLIDRLQFPVQTHSACASLNPSSSRDYLRSACPPSHLRMAPCPGYWLCRSFAPRG
jgi:hypothetical protein